MGYLQTRFELIADVEEDSEGSGSSAMRSITAMPQLANPRNARSGRKFWRLKQEGPGCGAQSQ